MLTVLIVYQDNVAQAEAQTQGHSQPQTNPSELVPRLCHLVRSEIGYGFNLHSERSRPGQYIRSLDPGSPADQAGLRPQDRLIEVGLFLVAFNVQFRDYLKIYLANFTFM